MKVNVRPAEPRDERRWRELLDGYCLFYERQPDEKLSTYTWRRILERRRRDRHRELPDPRAHPAASASS